MTENIVEDVKPNVEAHNGVEAMEDFADDDFNTEDMEALDAVEEKAMKTEIKVSLNNAYETSILNSISVMVCMCTGPETTLFRSWYFQ